MPAPVVAIVGTPNVGKSTLFNRLLGRRHSIVADRPGVTRDRLIAACEVEGRQVTLVDTGGMTEGPADDLTRRVGLEALKAVESADLILFLVDARAGITGADEHVAALLRSSGRPVIPVANKIDSRGQEGYEFELYRLGLGEVVAISAEQGRGLDELVERIGAHLGEVAPEPELPGLPLALIGRPNVGKSSLFNRLVRDDRSLVSVEPGTTRDPVDALFEHAGVLYRVVDTAGIRRHRGGADGVEWLSVLKARQALERAAIVLALVEAPAGVCHQDRALLGSVAESRKPAILVANKIDLVPGGAAEIEARLAAIREDLRFAAWVPVLPVSATRGRGVRRLLDLMERVRAQSRRRIPTPELNRVLRAIVEERHPPADRGHAVRLHYITQAPGGPPRFAVFGNGRAVPTSYRRYLENRLRQRLDLGNAPITLLFRKRPPR